MKKGKIFFLSSYGEPLTTASVKRIIEKEKPDMCQTYREM